MLAFVISDRRIWLWYGTAAAALVPIAALGSHWPNRVAALLVTASAVIAVAYAVIRHDPVQRRAWWLLWTAMALSFTGNGLWTMQSLLHLPPPPSPLLFDGVCLAAYPVGAIGLFVLVGRGDDRSRREVLLDGAIVALGLAIPAWSFLIDPALDAGIVHGQQLAPRLLYPAADFVIVALTARLWLTAGARTVSAGLLVLGQVMLLVGDAVGWDSVLRAVVPQYNPAQSLGLLAWFATCAAAALHPSMRKTYGGTGTDTVHTEHGRFLMLLVFALLGPVVTAVTHLTAREPNFLHSLITPALASLLAVILVVRMQLVTRVAQRRAAALDQQAAELSTALEEQQVLQHELSRRALHDPLTGLGNRALLHERMLEVLDGPAALLLLDLDGFKDVNDTYGHPAGDELLIQVAARLDAVLSTQDTLVRLGGDEFAILISEPDAAWTVAQQTLDVLRVPYAYDDRDLYLTTSIGLLESAEPTTPAEALRDADLALYAAKGAGKNQVVRFDPQLRAARLEHTRMTAGLHRALADQEFALHYQPVVDLSTGSMYAVEALLRWYPPGEDTVPPDAFIPTAEEIGLVVPIGAWVLEQACADAAAWHEDHGISVSVNVSARQLRDRSFCETVTRALRQSGLPPHALVLEITETMLVTAANVDADTVIGQLNALRGLGVRIAIDDFGTGYSSLSYLRELPVDVLKIDRSFTGSTQDLAFTRAILELSSSLSLQTVAEGVETVDQARQLQLMNCNFAQGYHFSRPVKAGAIDELLADQPAGVS